MKGLCISLVCGLQLACSSHEGGSRELQPPPMATAYTVHGPLVYTPPQWPQRLTADLYLPEGRGPFPGMVVVHGGSWHTRDRGDMAGVAALLASRGYVVANINYRRAPHHRYPAQVGDVRAAVRWLRRNATGFRMDPERVGGWGYSAGAHLVSLVAAAAGPPEERLQAAVAGGLPADLRRTPTHRSIIRFIGAAYAEAPQAWTDASPISHVSADDPPMFLYHGTRDSKVEVRNALDMKQALDRAGVPAELYLLHGGGHITTFLLGSGADDAAVNFLDRQLRAPRPDRQLARH